MSNCTSTMPPFQRSDPQTMMKEGLFLLGYGLSLWTITLFDRLVDGQERRRLVRQLARFDDRMLKDIGVTRASVDTALRGEQKTRSDR